VETGTHDQALNAVFRSSKNADFVKNLVKNPGFCHFCHSQYAIYLRTFPVSRLLPKVIVTNNVANNSATNNQSKNKHIGLVFAGSLQ